MRATLLLIILLSSYPIFATQTETIIKWIDKEQPSHFNGTTLGVPWPKGEVDKNQKFILKGENGQQIANDAWPIAFWPDGSVKWSAIAVAPHKELSNFYEISQANNNFNSEKLTVLESENEIIIDNKSQRTVISKNGKEIIKEIIENDNLIVENGQLVILMQDKPENSGYETINISQFNSNIKNVSIEQQGDVRATIKIEGIHKSIDNRELFPFTVRLYFYYGSGNIRIMHTFIFDGDEEKDFIKGIGLQFSQPMHNTEMYDRFIRFTNSEGGLFGEAVKSLTGLRRDAGEEIKTLQIEGEKSLPQSQFPERVKKGLPYIPTFGDYTLYQPTSNAFTIKKRTAKSQTWIDAGYGEKSNGVGYVGTPKGSTAFGIRNFWQSYPAQLDIRNMSSETATITMWLWAPNSDPMDLRYYHDGMGMDDYAKQWEGLEITYEDYEPGYGTPHGVARTSELNICTFPSTANRDEIINYANTISTPPTLMADHKYIQSTKVFGKIWNVRKTENITPLEKDVHEKLDWMFDYYKKQIEQHNWYGFWNYGDFMHSYDQDRHVWKYDIGGFAWDNSELSTDIWLWYYFLHSERADVFRIAEAMTRHTGEVDVHHIGQFAPLGSRHNVLHWGCSAKQMRISTAANRRFYYYLTADERVGDLMVEQIDAHKALIDVPPLRKRVELIPQDSSKVALGFGTDWGAVASAWLTQWERTGDSLSYNRLINSMKSIANQPQKFFTGVEFMDINSGEFDIAENDKISVSHLSAVFGLFELCAELIELIDMPEFNEAWLQYCKIYNASEKEQKKELGYTFKNRTLYQGHSRLTAYYALLNGDKKLAVRAWSEFTLNNPDKSLAIPATVEIDGKYSLNRVTEAERISTNYAAQWSLAAIQILKLLDSFDKK